MRQVFLEKGTIKVKEVSQPLLDDYSLLVDVHYSCISSGTEIATISHANESFFYNVPHKVKKVLESVATNGIDGTAALIKGKLYGEIFSLGYSCAGRVLAVGKKIQKFRPGDLVACAGAGYANHADLVCVPENLAVKIQNKEILKTASFATIGAIALQGIRRAQLQLGERVCVIGLGLLGQLTVKLAKIAGCSVIGVDIESTRLQSAKAHGADIVLHAKEDDIEKEIRFLTEQHGADATIVAAASKSSDPMQQAMICTRKKGRVVM